MGTPETTRALFETCMYRAMYERKYKTSADALEDKELSEFIWEQCVSFFLSSWSDVPDCLFVCTILIVSADHHSRR